MKLTKESKKKLIQRRLWNAGYKVKDISAHYTENPPCDLLVDGKHEVVIADENHILRNDRQIVANIDENEVISYYIYSKKYDTIGMTQSHQAVFKKI